MVQVSIGEKLGLLLLLIREFNLGLYLILCFIRDHLPLPKLYLLILVKEKYIVLRITVLLPNLQL